MTSASTHFSDDLAIGLFERLTDDINISIPTIDWDTDFAFPYNNDSDLFKQQRQLTNADLTSGNSCGEGAVDVLVAKVRAVLKEEYDQGRITQAEYTKALVESMAQAIGNGTQFLLNRDQSYWTAVRTQIEAATARIGFATARLQYLTTEAQLKTQLATYALTKLKLASEDVGYGTAKFNLELMLPTQREMVTEQLEAVRAQTLDTRLDGVPVAGSVGMQKQLHQQQITSYQRDAELKAARLFSDAWITMKTVDEGLLPPGGFANTSLDQILTTLKTNNGLVGGTP